MNYFILTTEGKFKEHKQWILDNTCLEWDGQDPEFSNDKHICGFVVRDKVSILECIWSTLVPIFFANAKEELSEKYPPKYWTINSPDKDTYNIKAPTIEAAIALFRQKNPGIATITGAKLQENKNGR